MAQIAYSRKAALRRLRAALQGGVSVRLRPHPSRQEIVPDTCAEPGMLRAVLGALRICGRWISQQVLERLSRRSQGPNPPSRTDLIADFCRTVGWRDAQGRLSISSASVALGKLEQRGKVQLPPKRSRSESAQCRGLLDDKEALPALPRLAAQSVAPGLRLHLVQDEHDPAHRLWNRLIIREHPLQRKPIVGAQLRYVVECDAGVVGAFGFGPAAFHLECRDQWIGWNAQARQQNRGAVVGLSRFLLRPGISARNLASQCYGLVLGRVARDWQQRYGIKPVLVETYVDRVRHQGRSLAASNWRRLGESKGRGRNDRERQEPSTPKDVWVYELEPQARSVLQAQQPEILAPRSVFAPTLAKDWVKEEMDGLELGDQRLNRRAERVLGGRWARPDQSFYRSFPNANEAKRAYELIENPRAGVDFQSLLAPHQQQTARRMAAERVVLLAQDTTGLSYNTLAQTQGLGTIGEDHTRGLFLHTLLAFRLDGIDLGTAWAEVWAREETDPAVHRNEQSVDEKESGRWIRALQAAGDRARQMPQTQVVVCGDRESDIYELYDQMQAAPPNLQVLVRGQHDRCLRDGTRLRSTLEAASLGGTMEVKVPRRKDRPARIANLQLRWLEVEINPPAVALKKTWPSLKVYALLAKEVGAPDQAEPIEWVLLTTWPIKNLKMARRLVRWYALRWGIECWHKVLKVVCGVERRQMKTAQTLERALALDMIVSSRVLLLNRLGKEHPNLPADLFYSPDELEILEIKNNESGKFPADQRRTILQANILTAMLVGFWARKSDGHPGTQILAEGLQSLDSLVWYKIQCENTARRPRHPRPPT
jgi:hypothetical protein